jgi:hypothetical protein
VQVVEPILASWCCQTSVPLHLLLNLTAVHLCSQDLEGGHCNQPGSV